MQSKRGSPLTRARMADTSVSTRMVNPCKPPRPRKGFVIDQSGGNKDEACGWERMPADKPDVPFGGGGELGSANSSGWCRGPA